MEVVFIKSKRIKPFSNLKFENWNNLLFFVIICFYSILFLFFIVDGARGSDYEAYWITGKIADAKGYSQIYSLSEMRNVYRQIIDLSGDYAYNAAFFNNIFPAPYFSLFFVPFQFLSRISIESGYILWTILNLALLIGYLVFFLRKTIRGNKTKIPGLKLLIPFLIS